MGRVFVNGIEEERAGQSEGPPPKKEKWRANYVPAPHFYNLNQACALINKAFGGFGCYLVGSSLERRDFRDVDVRMILADEEYDALFKNEHGYTNPRWSLMCTTISAWLSTQSGLPVDFQFQRQTQANADHSQKSGHPRQPLGIFHDYPGERPTEVGAKVAEPRGFTNGCGHIPRPGTCGGCRETLEPLTVSESPVQTVAEPKR